MKYLDLKKTGQKYTNREERIDVYFKEVAKIPMINTDRECVLAKLIREGDEQALEELTNANLRFVISIAKEYQNQGLLLGDLINEGNLGLIKAAKRFDETRGFKFITYAAGWIRQSILIAISEVGGTIRKPSNVEDLRNKILEAIRVLEQKLEREPLIDEVVEQVQTVQKAKDEKVIATKERVELILMTYQKTISLDKESSDENEGITLMNILVNPNDDFVTDELEAYDRKISRKILIKKLEAILGKGKAVNALVDHYGLNGKTNKIAFEPSTETRQKAVYVNSVVKRIREKLAKMAKSKKKELWELI